MTETFTLDDIAKAAPPAKSQPAPSSFSLDDVQKKLDVQSGKDAGLYASFLSGFASDEKEAIRLLADKLFPDDPLEKSLPRFSKHNGAVVYKADDGKVYEAMPSGWSPRAVISDILRGAGPAIPAATGTLAGAATLPLATTGVGLAGTMAVAGAGATLGEVARQKLGDFLLGRASTDNINLAPVISEGVQSAAGQGIGVGLNTLITRGAVRDIAKYDPTKTRDAYDLSIKHDVPITPAEATGLPSLGAQQKRLTNITATSDEMREFLDTRNQKVFGAWNKFLDDISGAADAEDVGRVARTTAQDVFDKMRKALKAEAEPYYKVAHPKEVPITSSVTKSDGTVVSLSELIKRPAVAQALEMARNLAANEGKEIAAVPRTVRDFDYIKRGLDAVLGSDAVLNKRTGGMNDLGRIVSGIKRDMLRILDDAVPEYAQARRIYSEGSEDLSSAMQSALKVIADTKDVNILNAARHVFDPKTRSPQMVGTLRKAIEGENPDAWQALKRLYINDVTTDALRAAETEGVVNPAGKIFKAFSNPKVAANLRVAMTPDEQDTFRELMALFRRASSVPALRSDTEFNRLISVDAQKAAQPWLAKGVGAVKSLNPANPNFLGLQALQDFLTERNMDKQAQKVVALVTSGDPDAIKAMRELRKLPLSSQEGILLFGHLLSRGTALALPEIINRSE